MDATGARQVEDAVADCVSALGAAVGRDWRAVRAEGLEWDCRRTAEHIADDLFSYAGQLAGRATDAYVPFGIVLEDGTDNAGALHVIRTAGTLLAATVRSTPRAVRAFHPYPFRHANREGFAAMGVAEVLLHTHDIAAGLGVAYEPPAALAEFVLTRLFPEVRPGPAPWPTLRWATGRGELPGRQRVSAWRWNNTLVVPAGRLVLEGVTPAAAADLSVGGDGSFDWVESGPFDSTRDAAGALLTAYREGVLRARWGMFVLVRREDDRAVGGMGFHGPPDEDGRVEIGYDLSPGARGHGYATEALRALSAWALEQPEVTSVFATTGPENRPSRAVIERAGFTRLAGGDGEGGFAYELRR
ncbi:GNAT family N-acetyltransferase [Streptomyces sp. bgisy022]|uniref:GNAT family N-acetyltransferase n=1 Tax=Streptomyces sp. bgisy022 TaxID=3413769 RepID=UPI003D73B166